MPQRGEFIPFPVARRVNSSHAVAMDDDVEGGASGPYQDKPRTFPNMRSKSYTPLVRTLHLSLQLTCFFSYRGLEYSFSFWYWGDTIWLPALVKNDQLEYVGGTILLFLRMMIFYDVVFCIEQCFPYCTSFWSFLSIN